MRVNEELTDSLREMELLGRLVVYAQELRTCLISNKIVLLA